MFCVLNSEGLLKKIFRRINEKVYKFLVNQIFLKQFSAEQIATKVNLYVYLDDK